MENQKINNEDKNMKTPSEILADSAKQITDEVTQENPPSLHGNFNPDWLEFQKIGLLWWTNRILHLFGWAIVYQFQHGKLLFVYPKRVTFRGFDRTDEEEGFKTLTGYLEKNSGMLNDEANQD